MMATAKPNFTRPESRRVPPKPRRLALACSLLLLGACETASTEEEPLAVAMEPVAAEPASERVGNAPVFPRAGVVTGGDIDDTLNIPAFLRYAKTAASETGLPRFTLGTPLQVQLLDANGKPAPGMRVTLRHPGEAEPFYSSYSGVDGAINVFPTLHGGRPGRPIEMRVYAEHQETPYAKVLKAMPDRHQVTLPFVADWAPDFLDLVFVVDTTGSMDDELKWLTAELRNIVSKAQKTAPGVDIRYGLIVYRDHGDEYVVKNYGFTGKQRTMLRWLRNQEAAGGGDYPEAAAAAMATAAALDWRRGKGERLLFHIADAPPHSAQAFGYLEAARKAGLQHVQIFGLGASGVAAESEYLMRQAAVMTGGRYLFLTNDSGVGNAHAEPTISCYRVTPLTDLVTRVLQTELTGLRVEANENAVLRSVGTYRRGVCHD